MSRCTGLFAILAFGCTLASAQAPVGELFASGANVKGSVVLAGGGTIVLSGSSVSAGSTPAILKLGRGGEVRICPGTGLTATIGRRSDLTFGLGTGTVELEYNLESHSDTVLTPDFRMLLAGPGSFHVAVGAKANGDTCVKSLERNAASVIVSEQMGDGAFQLRPGDAVLFRNGRIAESVREPGLDCGCSAPPPILQAANQVATAAQPAADVRAPLTTAPVLAPRPVTAPAETPTTPATSAPATSEAPGPAPRNQTIIDVPMAFSGAEAVIEPAPAPVSRRNVSLLASRADVVFWLPPSVLPPTKVGEAGETKPAKRGFFARFFGSLFGRRKNS